MRQHYTKDPALISFKTLAATFCWSTADKMTGPQLRKLKKCEMHLRHPVDESG